MYLIGAGEGRLAHCKKVTSDQDFRGGITVTGGVFSAPLYAGENAPKPIIVPSMGLPRI